MTLMSSEKVESGTRYEMSLLSKRQKGLKPVSHRKGGGFHTRTQRTMGKKDKSYKRQSSKGNGSADVKEGIQDVCRL